MTPSAEIEPGPHWWKASALTTRPTLPPLTKTDNTDNKNRGDNDDNNNKNKGDNDDNKDDNNNKINDENTNVGDDDNDLVPSQWQRYTTNLPQIHLPLYSRILSLAHYLSQTLSFQRCA